MPAKSPKPEKPSKLEIVVIVNGQPVFVEAAPQAVLRTVIVHALEASGNSGQPPDNWELRDAEGALLDPAKKIASYGFGPETKLFLNLKAGVGGAPA